MNEGFMWCFCHKLSELPNSFFKKAVNVELKIQSKYFLNSQGNNLQRENNRGQWRSP